MAGCQSGTESASAPPAASATGRETPNPGPPREHGARGRHEPDVQNGGDLTDPVGVVGHPPEDRQKRRIGRRELGRGRVAGDAHVREALAARECATEHEIDAVVVPEPRRERDQEQKPHHQPGTREQQIWG